ncbi:hypothetical protein L6164_028609 [Bauhinia variegata]|uniref:Uncharacterized protein n=1 Tax=Bauhinia variegata TaxID=167791 RepID=A0ACB9L669_BAUVA|nr:hypothetical protein L6164_028609 [Bauhinia variegata]
MRDTVPSMEHRRGQFNLVESSALSLSSLMVQRLLIYLLPHKPTKLLAYGCTSRAASYVNIRRSFIGKISSDFVPVKQLRVGT